MSDKIKKEFEFLINTSPKILYNMLSTPSGLSEWFCDDVNLRGDNFTFIWDGAEEVAELKTKKQNEYIKFSWEEGEDGEFFEFRIKIDPMTKQTALIITDFVEEDELEETALLWESQVNELKSTVGG